MRSSTIFALFASTASRQLASEAQAQDIGLMERVRRRDPAAVQELYDRHADMVYTIGLRILRDPTEAQDLVLDVFLHLWRRPDLFDGERGAFLGWLVSLARNCAIDRIRARRTRDKAADAYEADRCTDVAPWQPGPKEFASAGDLRTAVGRALTALPDVERTAIELAYFEGLSHREIAERLEAPLGTVKLHIRTGMIRLRDLLGESADVGPAQHLRKSCRRRNLHRATRNGGPHSHPTSRVDKLTANDSPAEGTAFNFERRTRRMSLKPLWIASSLLLAFLLATLLPTAASAQWTRIPGHPAHAQSRHT